MAKQRGQDPLMESSLPSPRQHGGIDQQGVRMLQDNFPPPGKKKKKKKKRCLKINLTNCKYESVRRAAQQLGLQETLEGEEWNLYWSDTSVTLDRVMGMKPYQKINHIPGMMELCRKDLLARNLNRMVKRFPKEYNIFPRSWCLPADYNDFQAYWRLKKRKTFICKPDTGSQGRGIFLARSAKDIPHGERIICQLYISRPLVIDGYKFDLRLYVLVTSCDPFHIFLYQEGLARFCTSQYCHPAKDNMENMCMHLTNYAINKHSDNFIRDELAGSKRKLSALTRLLEERLCDVAKLWSAIEDLVIKALISAHSVLTHSYQTCFPRHTLPGSASSGACFELLGFDVLLDHKLKPWLLEVNHSPSFTTDSAVDRNVKDSLLYDTLVLVNLTACDRRQADQEKRRRVRARLQKGHFKDRSEELAEEEAQREQRSLQYEDSHLGGYRRIFPREGERYDKYLEHSSSLFQETAASRAREKCAREQLQELYEKQQNGRCRGGVRGESAGGKRSKASETPLYQDNRNNSNTMQLGPPGGGVGPTATSRESPPVEKDPVHPSPLPRPACESFPTLVQTQTSRSPLPPNENPSLANSHLPPKSQYHPHPQHHRQDPLASRDLFLAVGQQEKQNSSVTAKDKCCHKATKIQGALPIIKTFNKVSSLKSKWLFAEQKSRGFEYLVTCPLSQVCESDNYSDLHIVSGPAPINKRPAPYRANPCAMSRGQDRTWLQPSKFLHRDDFHLPYLGALKSNASLCRLARQTANELREWQEKDQQQATDFQDLSLPELLQRHFHKMPPQSAIRHQETST